MAKVEAFVAGYPTPTQRFQLRSNGKLTHVHGGFGDQVSKSACFEEEINDDIQLQLENAMKPKPRTHEILICHHELMNFNYIFLQFVGRSYS